MSCQRDLGSDDGDRAAAPDVLQFKCDLCHHVDAPGNIKALSENEGRLLTSCDSCGGYLHNVCGYDLPTRKYLRDRGSLNAPVVPDLPLERVICKVCSSEWTYDLYNLNRAAKVCVKRCLAALAKTGAYGISMLSRARGFTAGGCLQAFSATVNRCTADIHSSTSERRVMVLLGAQGTGKSKLMDTMACSLWPDSMWYGPTPEGWHPVTEDVLDMLRERQQLRIPDPLVLPAELSLGQLAFGADGKLLGLHDMLELHANSSQLLSDSALGKAPLDTSKLVPGMLPFGREDQWIASTTMASIMALKDARHTVMLFTMNQAMLLELVTQLRTTLAQEERLGEFELGFLQAVFGLSDLSALPSTGPELAAAVVPAILDVIGELGTPVTITLPGKVPLHDRVYLVHLVSQVSGQSMQRQPWMWLIWLVARGVPSGLLPGNDATVDMAGLDSRPIPQVIRRWTLPLANSVILVVQKDFASYRPNPLSDMDEEGLLSRVAAGTLTMMVVLSDHRHYGLDKFLHPTWAGVEANWGRQEANCKGQLIARLRMLSPDSGQEIAERVPVVTVRALEFEGVMAALGGMQLTANHQEQLPTLLLRTGAVRMYGGMMRNLKCDTVQVLSSISRNTGRLEEMMHVLLGKEHPNLPDNREGGLGQFGTERMAECLQAMTQLRPEMRSFVQTSSDLIGYLPAESKNMFLQQTEELWASVGQSGAEAKVRRAVHNGSLPNVAQLLAGVEAVLRKRNPNKHTQAAQHLVPLVSWVQDLTLAHLESLLEPCRKFVVVGLRRTFDQVPAFQQLPELQRLALLWLQYVAPLVMENEVDTAACKRKLLQNVRGDLQLYLVEVVKALLEKLQLKMHKEGGNLAAMLDSEVIRAVWPSLTVTAASSSVDGISGKLLLKVVVEILHKHVVLAPLKVLARESRGTWDINFIKRLTADLHILMDPGNLNMLQEAVADLYVPAKDTADHLDRQFEVGAANLEKLIVLMHTHQALLRKYGQYRIIMFDSCSDRKQYNKFSKVKANGARKDIPLRPGVEPPQLASPGVHVDLAHLSAQLCTFVFGVQGQILLADGEEAQLSLADSQQQLQAVQDLLQRQLIHAAVDEQHGVPGSQWFTRAAGVSANQVLTTSSHLIDPRHMLALLAMLLGCYIRVLVPAEPNGETPAKRPRASTGSSSSSVPRGRRYNYLFVSPPARRRSGQELQDDDPEVAGATAAAAAAAEVAPAPTAQESRNMLVQLSLRQADGFWLFDVVSSTQLEKKRLAAVLGEEDDEYDVCVYCQDDREEVEQLLPCEGRYCTVALHADHLSAEQQAAAVSQDAWLCTTCTLRGRDLNNPAHLKPPRLV